jgi:hypothetical protein
MTQRKIANSLLTIDACKKHGYILEALLKNYHLNVDLLKFILTSVKPGYSLEGKKIKTFTREFSGEIDHNPALKSVINKKTFRIVKTWLDKMDVYFKELKLSQPGSTRSLMLESEKIFGVLNISTNKLFVRKKA